MANTDKYLKRREDGTIDHSEYRFSASQIATWLACKRKFGWTYLVGLRSPATNSQALGTRVHKQLEVWLNGGQLDMTETSGEIAFSGLEHLPLPHHELRVEKEFFVRPGDRGARHLWWGFKDLERGDEVYDHKTTSDLKWCKTEQELMYDPQAVLYAFANGSDVVALNWVYYQTKRSRRSRKVHLKMAQSHAELGFRVMEEAADEVIETVLRAHGIDGEALRAQVLSMPFNASECEAYGGCPHRGLCNLSPEDRFSAQIKQDSRGSTEKKPGSQTAPLQEMASQAPRSVPSLSEEVPKAVVCEEPIQEVRNYFTGLRKDVV